MANTAKSANRLKYNLKRMVEELPHKITKVQIIEHLERAGIPKHTFYRHQKIQLNSAKSISADHLLVYSKVFDCPIEQLVNVRVNAKSIREVIYSDKIHIKTNLR